MPYNEFIKNKLNKGEIMSKLYCCYSLPLRDFLTNNGIKYEIVALSPNSNSTMWIYIKSKKLDELLREWSLRRNA